MGTHKRCVSALVYPVRRVGREKEQIIPYNKSKNQDLGTVYQMFWKVCLVCCLTVAVIPQEGNTLFFFNWMSGLGGQSAARNVTAGIISGARQAVNTIAGVKSQILGSAVNTTKQALDVGARLTAPIPLVGTAVGLGTNVMKTGADVVNSAGQAKINFFKNLKNAKLSMLERVLGISTTVRTTTTSRATTSVTTPATAATTSRPLGTTVTTTTRPTTTASTTARTPATSAVNTVPTAVPTTATVATSATTTVPTTASAASTTTSVPTTAGTPSTTLATAATTAATTTAPAVAG